MIFKHSNYENGQLHSREEWDSVALTYTVFDGTGQQTSQRALTAEESAEVASHAEGATAQANISALHTKATQELVSNTTYLGITTPTAAQNAAQVKSLTRQVNALLRLELRDLADVSDT